MHLPHLVIWLLVGMSFHLRNVLLYKDNELHYILLYFNISGLDNKVTVYPLSMEDDPNNKVFKFIASYRVT